MFILTHNDFMGDNQPLLTAGAIPQLGEGGAAAKAARIPLQPDLALLRHL